MKALRLLPFLLMAGTAQGYDEPSYKVLRETDRYEIRDYKPYLVAETTVAGGFDSTGNVAFRRLAGYIFGGNRSRDADPPDQRDSVRMNMTVPVTRYRDARAEGRPTVYRFVMERAYDLDSLPLPDDASVHACRSAGRPVRRPTLSRAHHRSAFPEAPRTAPRRARTRRHRDGGRARVRRLQRSLDAAFPTPQRGDDPACAGPARRRFALAPRSVPCAVTAEPGEAQRKAEE